MNISRLGPGFAAILVISASAAVFFGGRYLKHTSPGPLVPKATAAAAPVRVNGSRPLVPPSLLSLSGEVVELAPGASVTVSASVGGTTYQAAVSGNTYSVSIGRPASDQIVTVEARSTRAHYRSVIGSEGSIRVLAGSDAHLTLSEQPALRVSPYSTALGWLVRVALGDRDATSDAEFEKMTRVAASSDLEHAAYVLAGFARNELYIPAQFAGYADGYQLLRDRDAFSQFISYGARAESAGYLFEQPQEQPLASSEILPGQLVFMEGAPREQLPVLPGDVFMLSRRGDGRFDFEERTPLSDPINTVVFDAQGRMQFVPVGNQVRLITKLTDVGGGQMASVPFERTAAGRTVKRLTRGNETSVWAMRSVWHDVEVGTSTPVTEEIEYHILSSTALDALAIPNGWSTVAASTVALPWMCGSYEVPEEQIYDLSECGYVEHRFENGGSGSTVDQGWKVDPQTMAPKLLRSQTFSWLLGAQGALDLTDGNVATTLWLLKDYPSDIGPAFYRSRSLAGAWSGKTMVGISMAARKNMSSWPASAMTGSWRSGVPDYLPNWYTTKYYDTLLQRNAGGTGQETYATNPTIPIWWQAVGGAAYDQRTRAFYSPSNPSNPPIVENCASALANGAYTCITRVQYFKPIARVGNRYYGVEEVFTRTFYPADPAQGLPEESWTTRDRSTLAYYDCTSGACTTAITSASQPARVSDPGLAQTNGVARVATPPRGRRAPGRLK